MAKEKRTSPSWIDVKAALFGFDRAGLLGLLQDLYAASKNNQAFVHARLALGDNQLKPYKATISRWISPDMMRNQRISISTAKRAIADYKKAVGRPEGLAELSAFYCEEALSFLESCSLDDERYDVALIRMYDQSLKFVLSLPVAMRPAYLERLDQLRSRAKHVGGQLHDVLNDLWREADVDEHDNGLG